MKQCPKCSKTYTDESLNFCLDDGEWLREDAEDEPATAILTHSGPLDRSSLGRALFSETDRTAVLPTPADTIGSWRRAALYGAGLAALVILGILYLGYSRQTPGPIVNAVAVMPFVNQSRNPEFDYLSDGMTETLISSLSSLPNLNVRPRSSVFRYKGKETDSEIVAQELKVDAVLNGRIDQRGDDVSLFVELVDTSLDKVVWSQQYSRKQSDLVALQSDMARDVSNKLRSGLSSIERAKVTKTYTDNSLAYQLYLKGNYHQSKFNEDGYKKSLEYYRQAIEADPQYALAYVGIGSAYYTAAGWYLPPGDAMPQVQAAAKKALDLDESLAGAHRLLAYYEEWYGWDWAQAEKESLRAIELDPNVGHDTYATYFSIAGRTEDARREMELNQSLYPLDLQANYHLANAYLTNGQIDSAIAQAKKTVELDVNNASGHRALGMAYAEKEMFSEAFASLEKANSLERNP